MKIAFYGSSLVSSYWNGAATYYRGLLRDLHARGHDIMFYEPDAFDRQAFLERFVDKGRYRDWLKALAVHRIVADDVPLRGCARYLEQTLVAREDA